MNISMSFMLKFRPGLAHKTPSIKIPRSQSHSARLNYRVNSPLTGNRGFGSFPLQNLWGCLWYNSSVSKFKPVQFESMALSGSSFMNIETHRHTHTQWHTPQSHTVAHIRICTHTFPSYVCAYAHTHTNTVRGSLLALGQHIFRWYILVFLNICKPYMFTSWCFFPTNYFLDCCFHSLPHCKSYVENEQELTKTEHCVLSELTTDCITTLLSSDHFLRLKEFLLILICDRVIILTSLTKSIVDSLV